MSDLRIRQLLETRVLDWAAARTQPLAVSVEDVPFDPREGETYLETFLLPATRRTEFLDGVHKGYTGIFQINVKTPRHQGAGLAGSIVEELQALFPTFAIYADVSGFKVQVVSPVSPGPALPDTDRYTVPVSFIYRSDTTT